MKEEISKYLDIFCECANFIILKLTGSKIAVAVLLIVCILAVAALGYFVGMVRPL